MLFLVTSVFITIPSCLFLAALWSPAGKRADLLALLCVTFSCVFVPFSYGVSGQVWYLVESIPDICLLLLTMSKISKNLCGVSVFTILKIGLQPFTYICYTILTHIDVIDLLAHFTSYASTISN